MRDATSSDISWAPVLGTLHKPRLAGARSVPFDQGHVQRQTPVRSLGLGRGPGPLPGPHVVDPSRLFPDPHLQPSRASDLETGGDQPRRAMGVVEPVDDEAAVGGHDPHGQAQGAS